MSQEITTLLDIMRSKLPEDKVKEIIDEFNETLKDIVEEEEGEKEPSEKKEFTFYRVYDKAVKDSEGVAPEFICKVSADHLPTDVELHIQHAINNVVDELSKKRGKKKKSVNNLYDFIHNSSKRHYDEGKNATFPSKEPIIELPLNLTFTR